MLEFFFWFGVLSFTFIITLLLFNGTFKDWIVSTYTFFHKLYLIRNDKPKFEVEEVVEWNGKDYEVDGRYYTDMNNDYKFNWVYTLLRDDCISHVHVHVRGSYIKKTGQKKREEGIDKILESE